MVYDKTYVPIQDKYALTVSEASEYFGVSDKKFRQLLPVLMDAGCVIQNGVKYLIKRERCEKYFDAISSI